MTKTEALEELKLAKSEIMQILKGTEHFVTGKPSEKPFDGFHMNACAMRAWAMVDMALQTLGDEI